MIVIIVSSIFLFFGIALLLFCETGALICGLIARVTLRRSLFSKLVVLSNLVDLCFFGSLVLLVMVCIIG